MGVPVYLALPLAHRRRRAGRPVQRPAGHRLQDPLLHRDARQLQSALRRVAVDHATPRPSTRSIRRRASRCPESELDFFTGLTASFGSHPISLEVFWMLVLAVVVGCLLHRSLFGFRLMAIGGNPVAAHARPAAGRRATRSSPSCCARCSRRSPASSTSPSSRPTQPNIGLSYTFPVFAAVIIGGASLTGGKGTMIGTHRRRAAPGRTAAGPGAALARTARAAALPRRGDHRRGGARPRAHQRSARDGRHERGGRNGGIRIRGVSQALRQHDRARRRRPRHRGRARCSASPGRTAPARSTLVRIIAGEERPSAGTLTFDGRPWSPTDDWHAVAVVHQEPQLFPEPDRRARTSSSDARARATRWPRLGVADAGVMDALGLDALELDAARRLLAGDAAAHRDRPRGRARRTRLPVRRAQLGADRRGIRRAVPRDAQARRLRADRASSSPTA